MHISCRVQEQDRPSALITHLTIYTNVFYVMKYFPEVTLKRPCDTYRRRQILRIGADN